MLNPLLDELFLKRLDEERNRTVYAKLTSLNLMEEPIESIEGVVTAGSISLDGRSAVRRTCNLTLSSKNLNINTVYWGFTTKVSIEIGLENIIEPKYPDIIWFPQGIYILDNFNTSEQVNSYIITVSGKDKMCLLNGSIGGNLNAETRFDIEEIVNEEGDVIEYKRPIKYIIKEMVHHYAQELFSNIIINDLDDYALEQLDYRGDNGNLILLRQIGYWDVALGQFTKNEEMQADHQFHNAIIAAAEDTEITTTMSNLETMDLYLLDNFSGKPINYLKPGWDKDIVYESYVDEDDMGLIKDRPDPTIVISFVQDNKIAIGYTMRKIEFGDSAGYRMTELTYPNELIAAPNDTITSVLDKFVNFLGNFEYFYNLQGQFVFQAKPTYVGSSWNSILKFEDEKFVTPAKLISYTSYGFEDGILTTAFQNKPNMGNIKNDYTVWGTKTTAAGAEIPFHCRYAIDKCPEFYVTNDAQHIYVSKLIEEKYQDMDFYKGINNKFPNLETHIVDWREIIFQMAKDYYQSNHSDNIDDAYYVTIAYNNTDPEHKISLYPYGKTGYEHYYHDIEGFWRLLYCEPQEGEGDYEDEAGNIFNKSTRWNKSVIDDPSQLIFWFDFYDMDNYGLGKFSIKAIGDRPKVVRDNDVKTIIYRDVPDLLYISQGEYDKHKETGTLKTGYEYLILPDVEGILSMFTLSTRGKTAHDEIDSMLYNYSYTNDTVTISSVPIYHLEPNTIVYVKDKQSAVDGYYIIDKIQIPLQYNGSMSVTTIQLPQRIY